MTHPEQNLGNVIRKYRKERGHTQNSLAEQMGITQRQVMYIENGQSYPKFETLCRLIQVLNIPPDHIFHPDIKPNDHLLESFIALYRSCPPEDQELVLATTKTLVDHLRRKQENSSQTSQT